MLDAPLVLRGRDVRDVNPDVSVRDVNIDADANTEGNVRLRGGDSKYITIFHTKY